MPKEIYSQEVFEKQVNGTIFAKEGRLQDFPFAGEGLLQSWRYSFDAGKQVFRASNSGKVFEKRLVKDIQGNPKWTTWVEIPDAEAHGIQAIAINDRPLQLPNSDGAIKLQVTPQMIDTYTKSEIYSLINQKITEDLNKNYIYVPWYYDADGIAATSPKKVLQLTYPDGGIKEQYYLVEPHQGTSGILDDVSFWIWDYRADINKDDWMEVNTPDMKAFVSYPVFKEHTQDGHLHLSGQFEREYWNQKVDPEDMEQAISGEISNKFDEVHSRIDEHLADINNPLAPHITPAERQSWNIATESLIPMPGKDNSRFIVLNGNYELAYEQISTGDQLREEILNTPTLSAEHDTIIIEGLLAKFTKLLEKNLIEKTIIEFSHISTFNSTVKLETETGIVSPEWTTSSGGQFWEIPAVIFDRIVLKSNKENQLINFSSFKINIYYKPITSVTFGDPLKKFQLNFIGPDYNEETKEGSILYNGEPLFEVFSDAAHTADWGKISGDINIQQDLNLLLAEVVRSKVNAAPMDSQLRYDVYKDSIIPSLIQQPGMIYTEVEIPVGDLSHVAKDSIIINNIQSKLQTELEKGFLPYSVDLKIEFVASYGHENEEPLSVYFETDNPEIDISPRVGSAPFAWHWPGDTYKLFDKIYLRGNDAEHLDRVKLIIKCIHYGDWYLQASGYQGFIDGTNIFVNSSGLFNLDAITTNLNISGLLSIETLGTHFNSSGLLSLSSDNTIINSREGQFVSESKGATINAKDGAIKILSSSGLQINLKDSDLRSYSDNVVLNAKDKAVIRAVNEFRVSGNIANINVEEFNVSGKLINLNASGILIDSEYSPYDEAENIVKIHGEEADERYASRPLYESTSGLVNTKVDKNLVGESGIIQDIVFKFEGDETRGNLFWKKNTVSLHDGTIEEISGRFDVVTEQELKEHYDELSGFIQEDRFAIAEEVKTRFEEISGEAYTREFTDTFLQEQIDAANKDLDDNYYTKEEINDTISGEVFVRESEDAVLQEQIDDVVTDLDNNYYTKEEIDKIHGDDQESFDITINNVEELKEFLKRNSPSIFEQSARILFKSGAYDLETDIFNMDPLDFSNIKYVKGEWPCTVNIYSLDMVDPINFDNTIFENIIFNIGPVGNQQIFNGGAKRIKTIVLDTPTKVVLLDPIYDIYRFIMESDCEVTFTEVITGKEYFFWVDQTNDPPYKFTTTNYFHNAESELFNGSLENQIAGKRTILILMGNNEAQANGFIEHEIIYGANSDIAADKKLTVTLGNTKAKLLDPSVIMVDFVHNIEGPGVYAPGATIVVKSQFVNFGWDHNDSDDFVLTHVSSKKKILPISGSPTRIGTDAIFKLPSEGEIQTEYNGSREFILDFNAKAIGVKVILEPFVYDPDTFLGTDYDPEKGFGTYQPAYTGNKVVINFKLDNNHHLYNVIAKNSDGSIYLDANQHTTPWEFEITSIPSDNLITIVPMWYEKIHTTNNEIDIKVNNPGIGNDGTKDLIRTEINKIDFKTVPPKSQHPDHPLEISLAPITIVEFDDTKIEVSTFFNPDGTQSGTIKVLDPTDTSVTFHLSWPGQTEDEINKLYTFNIIEDTIFGTILIDHLDSENKLHTGVKNHQTTRVSINWPTPNPTYKKGVWTVDNGATIVSTGDDTADLTIVNKGITKITFVADFNGKSVSTTFISVVHASSIKITSPNRTLTSPPNYEGKYAFYDEDGEEIPFTVLSDPLGATWETLSPTNIEIIDDRNGIFYIVPDYRNSSGTIKITSDMKNLDSSFDPYEQMIDELEITIEPNEYVLSVKNDGITVVPDGITPSEGNIFTGGQPIVLFVHFKEGYKATDVFKAELISYLQDPSDIHVIRDLQGIFEATIIMPCNDIDVIATGEEV